MHSPLPARSAEPCYAESERGDYVEDPDHDDLLTLLANLNPTDNTFFVIFPDDEELDWSIAVHTRPGALGGFEIERTDPTTGQHDTTPHADPTTLITEVLTWVHEREPFGNTP